MNKEYEGTFPNIEMNTVPHLQLVQFIEGAIKESEPFTRKKTIKFRIKFAVY